MSRHDEHVFVLRTFQKSGWRRSSERILDETSLTELPRREPRDKMTRLPSGQYLSATDTIRIRPTTGSADLIKAIDKGRVKGKLFSKAIEDFSPEELGSPRGRIAGLLQKKFS